MPFHIISQHTDKDVGLHMVLRMMPDRTDQQIDPLKTSESTLHLRKILIAPYGVFVKGSLTPGRLADMVVLDKDPWKAKPEEIGEISVELIILGGRTVYHKEG